MRRSLFCRVATIPPPGSRFPAPSLSLYTPNLVLPKQVLEMPHCYFVNDYRQSERGVIDSPAPERADHGLSLPPPPPWPLPPATEEDKEGGGILTVAAATSGAAPLVRGGRDYGVGDRSRRATHLRRGGGVHNGESAAAWPPVPGRWRRGGGGGGRGVMKEQGALENVSKAREGGGDGGRVVLCNFNRLHKLDPHTFGAWMEVSAHAKRDGGSMRGNFHAPILERYVVILTLCRVLSSPTVISADNHVPWRLFPRIVPPLRLAPPPTCRFSDRFQERSCG